MDEPIGGTIKAGGVTVDPVARRAFLNDEEIELSGPEFDLLSVLVRHPGEVFSRTRLRELAWERGEGPEPALIDAHLAELRRKLGEDRIEAVSDNGYRFAPHRGQPYA